MVLTATALAVLAAWMWFPSRVDERLHGEAPDPVVPVMRSVLARIGPRARAHAASRRMRGIRGISALAAELQAGQPPSAALIAADSTPSLWPTAVATTRLGGDVAEALRADAMTLPILRQVAACWQVSSDVGGGLATSITRLAAAARAAEDARVALEAELAGPRATARTLCLLPFGGVILGSMLGANPLMWLFGSALGWVCLLLGGLLIVMGAWWTGRIAARVERLL